MSECIFCRILKGEVPSETIFENDNVLVFKDVNPASPHHLLIIPKKHIDSVSDATMEDQKILGELLLTAKKVAADLKIDDYRLVINNGKNVGQTVFHIHVHLLAGRFFSWPPG